MSVWILSTLLFSLTLTLYIATSSSSLMFDDAAEFALVIRLGSIAHPPGFPSYIFTGMVWDKISSLFFDDAIFRLNLFSSLAVSSACVLLFLALRQIATVFSAGGSAWKSELSAFYTALAFGVGNTTWLWANTIEAYAFQVFSMGLVLYGLCLYQTTRKFRAVIPAAVGLALGWSNHHLTMIVFTPFVPFFFTPELFSASTVKNIKKSKSESVFNSYFQVLFCRDFVWFTGIAASLTLTFYGWMMWRAQSDYAFMFGKPENLDLLFYHIRGGAYTKNLTETSSAVSSSRLPYFIQLTFQQFLFFTPFLFAGCWFTLKNRAGKVLGVTSIFFLLMLTYQLRNNQWASTDAYLLLPFMALCLTLFYGVYHLFQQLRLSIVLPLVLIATVAMGYTKHDRKTYPVSDDLMNLLDKSAPKNSVILLSDWTTVIQYYYYRYEKNFRTDLNVLHYDFKFTHYHLLPEDYPDLYKAIQPEYDAYIGQLFKEQPYNAVNTGCDLTNPVTNNLFKQLLNRLEDVCNQQHLYFLTDPRANYLFSTSNLYSPNRFVSGCFSSGSVADSSFSGDFLKMDLPFLQSPLLEEDPSCLDKLVDFQAMLDQHINFYTVNRDSMHLSEASAAKEKILGIQRKLKKSMSFAYKVK